MVSMSRLENNFVELVLPSTQLLCEFQELESGLCFYPLSSPRLHPTAAVLYQSCVEEAIRKLSPIDLQGLGEIPLDTASAKGRRSHPGSVGNTRSSSVSRDAFSSSER
jgi:hypothetical protein